ncbi:MAG: hypothetical protein AB7D07_14925 [Desulfovibrionaceae bacterium]
MDAKLWGEFCDFCLRFVQIFYELLEDFRWYVLNINTNGRVLTDTDAASRDNSTGIFDGNRCGVIIRKGGAGSSPIFIPAP